MIRKYSLLFYFTVCFVNAVSQNHPYTTFGISNAVIHDVCFSKGGAWIVVPENDAITIYDTKTYQVVYKFTGGHKSKILSVDLSTDSSLLVSGGADRLVVVWDVKNQKVLKTSEHHQGVVTSVKFSPDSKYVASGSDDGTVQIYNLSSGTIDKKFSGDSKDITSLDFSSNGMYLAYGGANKIITLINTTTWKEIGTLESHNGWVRDISFSPAGSRMISCGDDGKIITWNISNPERQVVPNVVYNGLRWMLSTDIHSDNSNYVSGGLAGKLRIVVLPNIYKFKVGIPILKVRFMPNTGSTIIVAIATRGKGVILIDAKNMNLD